MLSGVVVVTWNSRRQTKSIFTLNRNIPFNQKFYLNFANKCHKVKKRQLKFANEETDLFYATKT